jgi:hypothetical protein
LLACAELVRGLSAIGWSGFAGLPGVSAYIRGEDDVPMEPEGQGPSLRGDSVHIRGPFRYSRHPLNALTIVLLWLNPRMTTTVLALNISSTVYLVLGSFHEEVRLRIRYGEAYERYVRSHVNFLA